jgi:hypothetical protein
MESTDTMERWFGLGAEVHASLLAAADMAQELTRASTSWAPEAVAVRLLLRSCRNLEGVLLLCRQGLVVESRTLARSLMENSFGVAALGSKDAAHTYLKMLRDDSEEKAAEQSRRSGPAEAGCRRHGQEPKDDQP